MGKQYGKPELVIVNTAKSDVITASENDVVIEDSWEEFKGEI